MINKIFSHFAQTVIFGIEDSLVSTVGLLSGIIIGGVDRKTAILTGIVLIFVEAISMAAGSFLSEASAEEIKNNGEDKKVISHSMKHGALMFFSYFIAGFIPLFPYIVPTISNPLEISIIASLAALFILGITAGKAASISAWKIGLRMLIVGGLAIIIGVLAGVIFGK
jgi:VIT1/CCC1 family predicted Fe2+/Mn2+ transporter